MVPSLRRSLAGAVPTGRRMAMGVACGCLATLALVVIPVSGAPTDPGYPLQWGLDAIGAPSAWDSGLIGENVTVAIVDSGIDLDHEDLSSKVVASVSCIGSGGNAGACTGAGQDDDGHGTHVAGIVAAAMGNGAGVVGVAPGARLMAVRVLRHDCTLLGGCSASGSANDVIAGIRWAVANGADVINLSVGSSLQGVLGPAFAQAIREAWAAGVVPVVAAGNDTLLGSGFSGEPALVVAATAGDGQAASYSTGIGQAQWGIAAPGGEAESDPSQCATGGNPAGILSTYWEPGSNHQIYACLAGTSMAAPHVSGAVAILLAAGLTPQEAVDRLLATATDLGPGGPDSTFGHGQVDVEAAAAGLGAAPVPPGPSTSDGTTTSAPSQPATTAPTAPVDSSTTTPTAPPASDPSFDPGQAAQLTPSAPGSDEPGDLPPGPVAVAVLMIAVTGCSCCWWAFRHASWARRTPG